MVILVTGGSVGVVGSLGVVSAAPFGEDESAATCTPPELLDPVSSAEHEASTRHAATINAMRAAAIFTRFRSLGTSSPQRNGKDTV
jgi:hypothetical protein